MTFARKLVGMGAALFAATLLFGALTTAANAQEPPMTVYGIDLEEGDEVEALIDGVVCGTATADADGQWMIQFGADADCSPEDGDTITFTLNGEAATATEEYMAGGAPEDVENGVALMVADATPTATGTLPPAETGNAGLLGQDNGSNGVSGLMLALGLAAAAAVVAGGARALTRKS